MKYLAYDGVNGEHEGFNTVEEARAYLEEIFLDGSEYHPDILECKIYELKEKVEYDVIADKADFTDKEWEDAEYSSEYTEIWKHKFTTIS